MNNPHVLVKFFNRFDQKYLEEILKLKVKEGKDSSEKTKKSRNKLIDELSNIEWMSSELGQITQKWNEKKGYNKNLSIYSATIKAIEIKKIESLIIANKVILRDNDRILKPGFDNLKVDNNSNQVFFTYYGYIQKQQLTKDGELDFTFFQFEVPIFIDLNRNLLLFYDTIFISVNIAQKALKDLILIEFVDDSIENYSPNDLTLKYKTLLNTVKQTLEVENSKLYKKGQDHSIDEIITVKTIQFRDLNDEVYKKHYSGHRDILESEIVKNEIKKGSRIFSISGDIEYKEYAYDFDFGYCSFGKLDFGVVTIKLKGSPSKENIKFRQELLKILSDLFDKYFIKNEK